MRYDDRVMPLADPPASPGEVVSFYAWCTALPALAQLGDVFLVVDGSSWMDHQLDSPDGAPTDDIAVARMVAAYLGRSHEDYRVRFGASVLCVFSVGDLPPYGVNCTFFVDAGAYAAVRGRRRIRWGNFGGLVGLPPWR